MSLDSGFADGGPAAALAALVSRLGKPVGLASLKERFFNHAAPHSLKALVDVAAELGWTARAFRADLANLDEVRLPAVVHLKDTHREESGFAVLVARGPSGYQLEEGAVPETHELTRNELAALWSGIVVTFEPSAATAPPNLRRAGIAWRLGRWFRGGDLAAPAHEAATRITLAFWGALVFGVAARLGIAQGSIAIGLAAAFGIGATLAGAYAAHTLYHLGRISLVPTTTPRLASKLCRHGTHADCDGVLSSRYATIFGVDLSSIGLAFFASNLALLAIAALLPDASVRALVAWLACAHLLAVPGALWLIGVQIHPLKRFCALCMACHGAVLLCAGLGAAWLLGPGRGAGAVSVISFAVLHALAFGAAFAWLVPYVGLGSEVRSHRTRLGWIAATPWGALAEMLGRGRPVSELPASPFRLGAVAAPFRIDAIVHPHCPGCGPVVDKIERLVAKHARSLAACFHVSPRDFLRRGDVALCQALYATSRAAGGDRALLLYRAVKADPWGMLDEAEADLRGVLARFAPDPAAAEAALGDARKDVESADALYQALKRGTPTVLVNGKPWESSLEDFDALLSEHPDLLVALLRVASRPAA